MRFTRITVDPRQMGGVPCIRGLRMPVATVIGMVADGMSVDDILRDQGLRIAGHDAVHVLDYQMHASTDEAIFERAAAQSRVIVSTDTDFEALAALREVSSPLVVLFRGSVPKRADAQVALILSALPTIDASLRRGAIVILESHRLRLRELPIIRHRKSDS